MREGLRSNTQQKREREMFDLNKDPSENKMPPSYSPSSTDYFSAEEKGEDVDSSVNMDVTRNADADADADADDVGKGEGGEGKEEKNPKSDGGGNSEGNVGKAESHLHLTNAGLVREEVSESEALGCGNNSADVGVVNVGASGDAEERSEAAGKKRRGRKRKVVGSGLSGDGGVGMKSLNEENAKLAKIGEGGCKWVVLEDGQDAGMGGGVAADTGGSTDEGRQKASKGSRGRKRKMFENCIGNKASEDMGKGGKLAVDDRPQIVGRVLRSRTMAATDGEKQAYREGSAGVGDQESELDADQSDMISTKVEIDKSARPARRGRKIVKGRRGRPPKMHGKNGNLKVTIGQKIKIGSQRNINLPRAKVVMGSNLVKKYKEKVTSDLPKDHGKKGNHKNEGEMGRNEEKQLLRNQIMSILKEAGWTIEYRPRMKREYLDAVYVDHEGRTYWSVTLAYKKLKQMVEDGTADAKAISAFTPIPEDELSKLYRISKEKRKKHKKLPKLGGSKTGKGPDKKFTARTTALSNCNANLNAKPHIVEKLSRKKKVDSSEQENSVVFSGRRKSKSRREGGRKPCVLLARSSETECDGDGFRMYKGKRTLLSWMIDWGTVSPGAKVRCMSHERIALTLEGKITREGIDCDCCGKVVTFADFESHAGSTLGQPYNNIFLESGHSLLQCMRESWKKQQETDKIGFNKVDVDGDDPDGDPHDDTCNICADGGALTCCDGCPSTFHHSCLQMENSPVGYWCCVHCSCKFCGRASLNDDEPDMDDCIDECCFCQEKFHVHCRLGKDATYIHSEDLPFCGRGCKKLFEHLQKLLGVRHELEGGYSWTILQRQVDNMNVSPNDDSLDVACNSKLAIALSIMNECFEPIIDSRSNINVIQSVIYSCRSNFRRLDFWRFYTFILERGDELVSAAAIRVHGNQLAEMPFIGTRSAYRRQGMCRRLLTAIEMALSSLEVEKLVIPAVSELRKTWTKVFGFLPLEESKRQEMKYMSMIAFPGADMLQKPLCKDQVTGGKTWFTGMQLSKPTIERVKGATTPAHNVDTSSAHKLQENVEAAGAVGSGGNITDGLLNVDCGITYGLEFTISSADMLQKPLCKDHVTEGKTYATGMQLSLPTIEHVKGVTAPARNVDASSADKLQKNVEAAGAVGSGRNITDGCLNVERGITNVVEFSISSKDENRLGGPLELCTGVNTEESLGDKLVSLGFTTVANRTSSDPNNEISPKSLSWDSLPYCPQPRMKSSNQSVGNTASDSEWVCNSTAHPQVAFPSTIRSCKTGGGPVIDPSLDC